MTTPPHRPDDVTPGGDPEFHHDDFEAVPPAPRDEERRAAHLAHLVELLGEEVAVASEEVSTGVELDVHVFAPTPENPWITLVTCGMSDHPMPVPGTDGTELLELLIALPPGWPGLDPVDADLLEDERNYWPMRLLKEIALIPSSYDAYLGWGHSLTSEDGEPYADDVPFTGAMIGPPYGLPPAIMEVATPSGTVRVLAVLPLTPEELDLKVSVADGGTILLDRFWEAGIGAVLDPQRQSVAERDRGRP